MTSAGLGTQPHPFGYTGRRWDPDLGLYYYRARWYDPALGTFLQTDPIGSLDYINLYAYVGLEPGNGTDPTGMETYRAGASADLTFGVGIGASAQLAFSIERNGTIEIGVVLEISGRAGASVSAGLQGGASRGSVSSQTGMNWDGTARLGIGSAKVGGEINRNGAAAPNSFSGNRPVRAEGTRFSMPKVSVAPKIGLGLSGGLNARVGIPLIRIPGTRRCVTSQNRGNTRSCS